MSLLSWSSLPSLTPSHPSRLSQSTRLELPASYRKFLLAIDFTCGNVCFHDSLSKCLSLLPPLGPQVCSLCLHLHCCPANRFISTIFLESISSVQFSHSVVSDSLWPHELQHTRPSCPSPTPRVYSLMSIESVMPSNHLILCCPLLLLPSVFPSIRVFSNESALHIRWPKYWSFQLQHQSFQWILRTDFL